MDYIVSLLANYPLPPIFIAFVVGVPSLVLYVGEVGVLLGHGKRFGSAFYRLFLARAVVHIVNYFNSYAYTRFGRMGLFLTVYLGLPSWMLAFSWFLN